MQSILELPTEDFPSTLLKYHGWFSQKQSLHSDHYIYLNEKGEEVTVTEVSKSAVSGSKWTDLEYKGVMVKWVRTVDNPKSLWKVPRPYDRITDK